MYTLNPTTKQNIEETLYEAGMLLSSIPNELLTPEMQEKVDIAIYNCSLHWQTLGRLKQIEEIDIREFHQMD